jgi:hypothetical protein
MYAPNNLAALNFFARDTNQHYTSIQCEVPKRTVHLI